MPLKRFKAIKAPMLLAATTVFFCSTAIAFGQKGSLCLGGRRATLLQGQFSGPLICSEENATFILAGRTSGSRLSVYDYRYRYLPAQGQVFHGGQRIVVFRGQAYVGQYMIGTPPFVSVSVNGANVVLRWDVNHPGVKLDFSHGPPDKILVNGEVETFFR